jgi:uncharacterized protein with GYD domain
VASAFFNSLLEGNAMAIYVTLMNFTKQGLGSVKDTVKRAEAAKKAAREAGATSKEALWTQGQYDIVLISDAPDDATATALLLTIAKQGNVRTQTLRAFTAAEMQGVLDKVG